jgi:hypothetical protein
MCTSTVAAADALPGQPVIVIGDSTVARSGICTSPLLVVAQPVGVGVGVGLGVDVGVAVGLGVGVDAPRLSVQESMRPTSAAAASWTRSLQVPFAGSDARSTVYVWSMLSVLPPERLCRAWVLPSGATSVTMRSPM